MKAYPSFKEAFNWAEKLQSAASKYESQKQFEAPAPRNTSPQAPTERNIEYTHFDNSAPVEPNHNASAQNRESRIGSIAEKLGFFNFDEDEFVTPSFMKKNEIIAIRRFRS